MDEQSISLPQIQLVVFQLDNEEYAVSILEVKEVIKAMEITAVPQSSDFILGIINLRGKIVTVFDLEKKFQLVRETADKPEHILIAEGENNSLFGILVDKVSQVLKVDPETIKPTPKLVNSKISQEFLKGVIVLGDRMVLVLDLYKVLTVQEAKIIKDVPSK